MSGSLLYPITSQEEVYNAFLVSFFFFLPGEPYLYETEKPVTVDHGAFNWHFTVHGIVGLVFAAVICLSLAVLDASLTPLPSACKDYVSTRGLLVRKAHGTYFGPRTSLHSFVTVLNTFVTVLSCITVVKQQCKNVAIAVQGTSVHCFSPSYSQLLTEEKWQPSH